MTCPKCGSDHVEVQVVVTSKLVDQHHGVLWWIFVGWWLVSIKWLFLTVPALFFKIFGRKKQKIKQKEKRVAVCQDCGHSWDVK